MSFKSILRIGLALALALPLLLLTSCEPIEKLTKGSAPTPPANVIGVLDLEEVARRLGRSEALLESLTAKEQELGQQLEQLRGSLQEQVEKRKTEVGAQPTPEQETELKSLAGSLNQEFQKARLTAQETLAQERVAQVKQFRTEVFPVANEIARERGFTTILIKSESVVFAWAPGSDITEEVIRRMATPVVP